MVGKKSPRQIGFALASALLGALAFYKINAISGPAFEPIIAACSNPDYKGSMDDFVSKTGYQAYEPLVGLKVFELLVCLITQFLYELRQTYPAGLLTWGGVILAAQPASIMCTVEAGRKEARGFVTYAVLFGLLGQIFGISVVFPLLWVPGYILGRGTGPISKFRARLCFPMTLPGIILTAAVFTLGTSSYAWRVCAGMLGGPVLAMVPVVLWTDSPPLQVGDKKVIRESVSSVKKAYEAVMAVGAIGWFISIYIVYETYGSAGGLGATILKLWSDIWVNANASVAFMTIDTIVLYIGVLLAVAFQSWEKAMKAISLTPFMGPAAASLVLGELEDISSPIEKSQQKLE